MMKLFLDTANIDTIKKWVKTGIIDGVTTNPSHLSKEKIDPKKQILAICSLLPAGEISVEVTEKEPQAVYKQAKKITQLADNILVKIPCHESYYSIIKQLVDEGIRLNITLVFSLIQGVMMGKLGVTYISPFIGRLDDIDVDGVHLLQEMRQVIYQYGFETGILAASVRHVRHLHDALMAGADAITLPSAILQQALEHPLTDRGIEKFDTDWQKLGIKQFP